MPLLWHPYTACAENTHLTTIHSHTVTGRGLNTNLFSQTLRATPGYPSKIPGYFAKRFGIPGFRRTYRIFWPPPLHVEDPHPTRKYPDSKSLGLGSFFFPELWQHLTNAPPACTHSRAPHFQELAPRDVFVTCDLSACPVLLQLSETGRIQFRRVRFQTPNSMSFLALTEFRGPGRELSEFLSA